MNKEIAIVLIVVSSVLAISGIFHYVWNWRTYRSWKKSCEKMGIGLEDL